MAPVQEVLRRLVPGADWAWAILEAQAGYPTELAKMLRSDVEIPYKARQSLADIIEGKTRLPRAKKSTVDAMLMRYWRERQVVSAVRNDMQEAGRQRDKKHRTQLMRKWACVFGTTPANVERYLSLPKPRRNPRLPKALRPKAHQK
jgi:hypothetical protein